VYCRLLFLQQESVLDFSVLMTVAVPVLPCTTLSQRAVPATLLSNPVVCRIPGGRTVFSCHSARDASLPLYLTPPKEVQKTTKYFRKFFFRSFIAIANVVPH
jgi:hypothetical protein